MGSLWLHQLGDYSDHYCCTDVLLLADVVYGLDPARYYTGPGLSWEALLKKTGVELDLLTDYDQHLCVEKGMRGGISMVTKHHARANKPQVEGYDPVKPNSHILYLDANNFMGGPCLRPYQLAAFGGWKTASSCPKPL